MLALCCRAMVQIPGQDAAAGGEAAKENRRLTRHSAEAVGFSVIRAFHRHWREGGIQGSTFVAVALGPRLREDDRVSSRE
jgi:hypothetical protein